MAQIDDESPGSPRRRVDIPSAVAGAGATGAVGSAVAIFKLVDWTKLLANAGTDRQTLYLFGVLCVFGLVMVFALGRATKQDEEKVSLVQLISTGVFSVVVLAAVLVFAWRVYIEPVCGDHACPVIASKLEATFGQFARVNGFPFPHGTKIDAKQEALGVSMFANGKTQPFTTDTLEVDIDQQPKFITLTVDNLDHLEDAYLAVRDKYSNFTTTRDELGKMHCKEQVTSGHLVGDCANLINLLVPDSPIIVDGRVFNRED